MAKDKILKPFLGIIAPENKFTVDTISELINAKHFALGDIVEVLGETVKGDGAHHKRIAKDKDDGSGELGQDGIWWCMVENSKGKTLKEGIDKNKSDILLKANTSDIPNLIGEISKQPNGWCKLANGMIMQWGVIRLSGILFSTVDFPISFTRLDSYSLAISSNGTTSTSRMADFQYSNMNPSQFKFESSVSPASYTWIALGY